MLHFYLNDLMKTLKMASKNLTVYNSVRNASISTKLSGIIPVVTLGHSKLSRSHGLAAILDLTENTFQAILGSFFYEC